MVKIGTKLIISPAGGKIESTQKADHNLEME